jgi:hypothetical protein
MDPTLPSITVSSGPLSDQATAGMPRRSQTNRRRWWRLTRGAGSASPSAAAVGSASSFLLVVRRANVLHPPGPVHDLHCRCPGRGLDRAHVRRGTRDYELNVRPREVGHARAGLSPTNPRSARCRCLVLSDLNMMAMTCGREQVAAAADVDDPLVVVRARYPLRRFVRSGLRSPYPAPQTCRPTSRRHAVHQRGTRTPPPRTQPGATPISQSQRPVAGVVGGLGQDRGRSCVARAAGSSAVVAG